MKITEATKDIVINLYKIGKERKEISEILGIGRSTVSRIILDSGIERHFPERQAAAIKGNKKRAENKKRAAAIEENKKHTAENGCGIGAVMIGDKTKGIRIEFENFSFYTAWDALKLVFDYTNSLLEK